MRRLVVSSVSFHPDGQRPDDQIAVFPGRTHFFGLARTDLVMDAVTTFLDAPEPEPGD